MRANYNSGERKAEPSRGRLIPRLPFGKFHPVDDNMPDLLEVQLKSYQEFLQKDVPPDKRERKGLQAVFLNVFPILDNREERVLEFVEYTLGSPKYTEDECRERGATYEAPLKVRLRLSSKEDVEEEGFGHTVEAEVYMGNIPLMTPNGTFIINGAERVIVSQLHRSPGVFFSEAVHPNGNVKLYSARVIPFRGSWIEFSTDINDAIYVFFDRHKKIPVTTLLRALGYSNDEDIWALFGYMMKVSTDFRRASAAYGWLLAEDVVNTETGEELARKGESFTPELNRKLKKEGVKSVLVRRVQEGDIEWELIKNTLLKDPTKDQKEALFAIYKELRGSDPADLEAAKRLIYRTFFDVKRYDLGKVGRYRLNKKLGLNIDLSETTLTREDIVAIIHKVILLRAGKEHTDDIDHLGNRRVRTVGEQLTNQFTIALSRLARFIKERMNIRDSERLQPQDLINVRTVTSVIKSFFGTNPLSQFLDQENPLAELTHKRRLSALGPGGLTRERAGFEVRDVHYTHYGRLCPIETPEGPNIGLISSLCTYARINEMGFLETAYRRVENGQITGEVVYLDADTEDRTTIAPYNVATNGRIELPQFKARLRSDYPVVKPPDVQYIDVSPYQILSVAAGLIPFLEHNDANRALMGSNMQRQAVPLLRPEAPRVGTGLEARAARDSRALLVADADLKIIKVSADEIIAEREIKAPTFRKTSKIANKGDLFSESLAKRLKREGIGEITLQKEVIEQKSINLREMEHLPQDEGWRLGEDLVLTIYPKGEPFTLEMRETLKRWGEEEVSLLTQDRKDFTFTLKELVELRSERQYRLADTITLSLPMLPVDKKRLRSLLERGASRVFIYRVVEVEVNTLVLSKWKGWVLAEDICNREGELINNSCQKGKKLKVDVLNAIKQYNRSVDSEFEIKSIRLGPQSPEEINHPDQLEEVPDEVLLYSVILEANTLVTTPLVQELLELNLNGEEVNLPLFEVIEGELRVSLDDSDIERFLGYPLAREYGIKWDRGSAITSELVGGVNKYCTEFPYRGSEAAIVEHSVVREEVVNLNDPSLSQYYGWEVVEDVNYPPRRELVTYRLRKFYRTNQDTCINQRPLVNPGDFVRKGEILADGFATDRGELALGRNVLVAFMPWNGYNFEDSIIVSERLVHDDILTSIHIEEVELQVRETKRGQEELTRDIPNVSEEATKDLDQNGIIRVGAVVKEGDILIGKVTPKGESELTPEDRLLKAIFGEKAGDVKNASKVARPGMKGVVIDTKLFSRKRPDERTRAEDRIKLEQLEREFKERVTQLEQETFTELSQILNGQICPETIWDRNGEKPLIAAHTHYTPSLIKKLPLEELPGEVRWTEDEDTNVAVEYILQRYRRRLEDARFHYTNQKHKIQVGDELPPGVVQLAKVYIAQRRKIEVGDKMAGRHGNKGVVSKIAPVEDMPFLPDGTPVDIVLNPLGVPSRMNLGQLFETALGWAAEKLDLYFATPFASGATWEDVQEWLEKAGLPKSGKITLYDGQTGMPFDQPVTVGCIYMMKLSHMVEDKIHARSIGPYSLITQQPLGGKAQFGGQRFGEMEVWALEAYGAAHTLQEILTVKSDDVPGRSRAYEAIVKGDILPPPGVPESFNVLINELMGLGLDVRVTEEEQ